MDDVELLELRCHFVLEGLVSLCHNLPDNISDLLAPSTRSLCSSAQDSPFAHLSRGIENVPPISNEERWVYSRSCAHSSTLLKLFLNCVQLDPTSHNEGVKKPSISTFHGSTNNSNLSLPSSKVKLDVDGSKDPISPSISQREAAVSQSTQVALHQLLGARHSQPSWNTFLIRNQVGEYPSSSMSNRSSEEPHMISTVNSSKDASTTPSMPVDLKSIQMIKVEEVVDHAPLSMDVDASIVSGSSRKIAFEDDDSIIRPRLVPHRFLSKADMILFPLMPLIDAPAITVCTSCKKRVISSQFSRHVDRCKRFTDQQQTNTNSNNGNQSEQPMEYVLESPSQRNKRSFSEVSKESSAGNKSYWDDSHSEMPETKKIKSLNSDTQLTRSQWSSLLHQSHMLRQNPSPSLPALSTTTSASALHSSSLVDPLVSTRGDVAKHHSSSIINSDSPRASPSLSSSSSIALQNTTKSEAIRSISPVLLPPTLASSPSPSSAIPSPKSDPSSSSTSLSLSSSQQLLKHQHQQILRQKQRHQQAQMQLLSFYHRTESIKLPSSGQEIDSELYRELIRAYRNSSGGYPIAEHQSVIWASRSINPFLAQVQYNSSSSASSTDVLIRSQSSAKTVQSTVKQKN